MALERRTSIRVGVALPGQNVGDPVDGGLEPDRITRIRAGDDQLQAVLDCVRPSRTNRCLGGEQRLARSAPSGSASMICGFEQGFLAGPTTPHPTKGRVGCRPSCGCMHGGEVSGRA